MAQIGSITINISLSKRKRGVKKVVSSGSFPLSVKVTCFPDHHTGEANVYTLGQIGDHLVVSTKLPMTGRTRDALIATGGTTTRLLGTFQVMMAFSTRIT